MTRYRRLTFLTGFILLLTVACAGYPRPGNYPPPPPPYEEPPPPYNPPPPPYDEPVHYGSTDQRIHDDVHRALDRAPALRDARIGVRVENRNVYLSGTVYSYNQKKVAHEIAHSVDGVRRVFAGDIRVYH